MAKLSVRTWILIIALILSVIAINPNPFAKGVELSFVQEGSPAALAGIKAGEQVLAVNRQPIETLSDYNEQLRQLSFPAIELTLQTDKNTYDYAAIGTPGLILQNLTVQKIENQNLTAQGMKKGEKVISLNKNLLASDEEFVNLSAQLFPTTKFVLTTDRQEYVYLIREPPEIRVRERQTSNIKKGLELQGGTRVLLNPVSSAEVTDKTIDDIIAILTNRLNVYGLADLKIRPANDLSGNKFILIEIAGVTREEVRDLIAQQGKFEAKIGDETVFIGGHGDLPFVCRNDGSCAGIVPPCQKLSQDQYSCQFQFAITLSQDAAEHHSAITGKLKTNFTALGETAYLEKQLDLYLDDQLVDSLNIAADLKGKAVTQIAISGGGAGVTEEAAYADALKQMNKLQTILITGSLPVKLEILKLDTISPVLGQAFIKNIFVVALAGFLSVAAVLFLRYRRIKITLLIMLTSVSEMLITLGFASLSGWSFDISAIAGLIAAIGTGVNDQIVMLDEGVRDKTSASWKEKLKRGFKIILTAWLTMVVAMIPLGWAGAGLIRGFALTTIAGITIGILITRPAFADMVERVMNKEQ